MGRAKNWCFTLNNYTDEDLERLQGLETEESLAYCIFGKEVGESGTPHLQGFIAFTSRKTRCSVIAIIGQAHLTIARSVDKSIEYCKKDGQFTEIGTPVTSSEGKRSDLEAFKEEVVSGVRDLKVLRANHSEVFAKYPRFCIDFIQDNQPVLSPVSHLYRPWQHQLFMDLCAPPDPRKVIFLVDIEGNSGKTWFARHYCHNVGSSQVLLPGKKADMAYALDASATVIFIDAPRSKQGEYLQYDFLEELKNGYVFSSKYESRMKTMAPCHVVVCMNEQPDLTKLSFDRYDIRRLTDYILNP